MRIALLTDGISPLVTGGMQKHSYYLAKFLAKNKVYVDLYHCVNSNVEYSLSDLYSSEELEYIKERVFVFPKKGFLPFHYIRNSFKYSLQLLESYLATDEADFIYAQGFTAWAFFKEKQKGKIKAPIGVNFHGLEMFQLAEGWRSKFSQYMFKSPVKYNLQSSDYAYSLGGKLTDIVRQFCEEKQIVEISIGLDESWLRKEKIPARAEPGRTKLVFVGRYERRKGIEELNQVMSKLEDQRISYDFIGPIPQDKRIESENITYHGLVKKEEDLKSILDAADILICPSLAEGMPTVILEAMARGLAIIATNVGAVSIEVDNENGWVIPAGNASLLQEVVQEALNTSDETLLSRKIASLNKIKSQFLWDRVVDTTIRHFEKSIQ